MKAFGIELKPRRKGIWREGEFLAFACAIQKNNLSKYIKYVLCCNNSGDHMVILNTDSALIKHLVIGIGVKTLRQFSLDDFHHVGNTP